MSVNLDVAISDHCPETIYIPDVSQLQQWAQSAYQHDDDAEASLQVVSNTEIQQLNAHYRDKDMPTNVLSFPMELPAEVELKLLGDLAISAEVVAQEAEQQGKAADAHWAHMIVHGMLHLQGYDHIDEQEAQQMESLEISILQQLGFDNPYITEQ